MKRVEACYNRKSGKAVGENVDEHSKYEIQ